MVAEYVRRRAVGSFCEANAVRIERNHIFETAVVRDYECDEIDTSRNVRFMVYRDAAKVEVGYGLLKDKGNASINGACCLHPSQAKGAICV